MSNQKKPGRVCRAVSSQLQSLCNVEIISGHMATKKQDTVIDYRTGNVLEWVRRAIDEQFDIEDEDARRAGTLGYMTRALVLATMPCWPISKADVFTRLNGDFVVCILAGYEGGIPYGIYPGCSCPGSRRKLFATSRQ